MKSSIASRTFLFVGVLFQVILFSSCGNSGGDDLKAKELELKERELKLKEQELNGNTPVTTPGQSSSSNTNEVSFVANAYVSGNSVILRADHSTTSNKVKSMKKNDGLIILDEFIPDGNYGEAILTQKTDFFSDYNGVFVFSLPRGKAVMVEGKSDGYRYDISYQDAKSKSRGFAKISPDLLEFISGKAWYHVRLADGTIGWVFSEFVQKM
jgi:hypothetical protein